MKKIQNLILLALFFALLMVTNQMFLFASTHSLALMAEIFAMLLALGILTAGRLSLASALDSSVEMDDEEAEAQEASQRRFESQVILFLAPVMAIFSFGLLILVLWAGLAVLGIGVSFDALAACGYLVVTALMTALVAWRFSRPKSYARPVPPLALEAFKFMAAASLLALAGMVTAMTFFPAADTIAAVIIAAITIFWAWTLVMRTIRSLFGPERGALANELAELCFVDEVLEVHDIDLTAKGTSHNADIKVAVSRSLTMADVQQVKTKIAASIREVYPEIQCRIDAEPIEFESGTIANLFYELASSCALQVQRLELEKHPSEEKILVRYRIEVLPEETLAWLHERQAHLESLAILHFGDGLSFDSQIELHDDPRSMSKQVEAELLDEITNFLDKEAKNSPPLIDVYDVKAAYTQRGISVNYLCRAEADASFGQIDAAVSEIERGLKDEIGEVYRVVGKPEPVRLIH